MDLVDIFRFRIRVGPGLAAGFRITDYAAFYFGEYKSFYAGLPGPRRAHLVRWPIGGECLTGVVFGGVDATDDTFYGPDYGTTEVDVGIHLGVVGMDAGVDPMEFADFLTGFFMYDLEGDDYPRPRGMEPRLSSGVLRGTSKGMFLLAEKPENFTGFTDRLDYLHANIHQRICRPIRAIDEYFASEVLKRVKAPDSRLRLGVFAESVRGKTRKSSLNFDTDLDVALPNMENRIHVFAQSGHSDELPGLPLSETKDESLIVGMRRFLKHSSVTADVGVRVKLHSKAFARVTWHPRYDYGQWSVRPQQRFFLDTEDRLGSLSSFFMDRWLGDGHDYYTGTTTAARYTQDSNEWTWEQSLRFGKVHEMLERAPIIGRFGRLDIASGNDLSFHVFGKEAGIDTYQLLVGMRRPLYQRWILWKIEPGLEWTKENSFNTAFRIMVGVDLLFWGPIGK